MSLGADYRAVQVMLRSFGLEPCFTPGNGEGNQVTLGKEEISGVNLATFYVFDKESDGTSQCYNCRPWLPRVPPLRRSTPSSPKDADNLLPRNVCFGVTS
jgi:hypothetical protein